MSKHHNRGSHRAEPNAPITALTAPPIPEQPQEKTMPAVTEVIQDQSQEAEKAQTGPTAKELAAIEERHAVVMASRTAALQEKPAEDLMLKDVAAKGRDALQEQFRKMNEERAKKEAYKPPERTARQMEALNEEMEAGRRATARAEAQQAARPQEKPGVNEGYVTPVYRPGSAVPDPTVPATGGFVAGSREFGPDAP